jgi:hypothetical protein
MMVSVAEVAGMNARALRGGATLEQLTVALRPYGLQWSTGRAGDFENGRAAPNLTTLYAVAAALGDIIGRTVALAELFDGRGPVAINDELSVDLAKLREALSGVPVKARKAALKTTMGRPLVFQTPAGVDPELHRRVLVEFRESDRRMSRSLGVTPEVAAAAMAKLWRRTFVAERDRLVGPDANAQKRGRISRRLKAQLQEALN